MAIIVENSFYGYKNKCFRFINKCLVKAVGKISPCPQTEKLNGLSLIKKSNLDSIPPCLLYKVQQQHFKDGLKLQATYHECLYMNKAKY